ncbi:BlaI/MecI/CopY family transcriptional regulator [Streptomyces sp. NBC_01803]|uniref:BlaI/MecI/CopY family transcriptional regulator n=1 Tax=Streptomyces sp. NBC_01803 TaxID=2975946 RepID=UPI002DD95B99|nr:BlaI/MecI/CopY family transcriptional regulator [Streptomyces sp. NBC_01803]WSA47301.1 BlaI/MecI/CopY family transcriptional regulator [Streptomyces sp. NBC_01803]
MRDQDQDQDGRPRRRGRGELEAQVLAALRRAERPVAAAWVREWLGGGLAHTTVVTILSRLHAKGAVTRERAGRAFVWTPAADRARLAARRMCQVLEGEPDREAVLAGFAAALSSADARLLRGLLGPAAPREPRGAR